MSGRQPSATAVLLTDNGHLPVRTLPVSWQLPASAAPVVSEAFYPFTGFAAATEESDRRMGWNTRPFGQSTFDLALGTAAGTAHQAFMAHLARHRVCAA